MIRPPVCRPYRKLKQNTKKPVQCSKDRKKVPKNFICDRNLSGIHNSKLKLSVPSSRVHKLRNEPNAVSGRRKTPKYHSQSKTTLKNFPSKPCRKSVSMRLRNGETFFKPSNIARRITRSSLGSVLNSPAKKKVQKTARGRKKGVKNNGKLATRIESKKLTTLRQSQEKPVTVNLTAIEKELVVIEESKRVTRSSSGGVTGLCSLRNVTPKSKPLQLSSKVPSKSKQKSQINERIVVKDSKRETRSSFGSKTSFTTSQNGSVDKCIKSKPIILKKDSCVNSKKASKKIKCSIFGSETGSLSSQIQSAGKHIKSKPVVEKKNSHAVTEVSKKMTHSSLGSVTNFTPIRNKNFEDKLSSSFAVQSSDRQVKLKQTVKEKKSISAKDSKRMTRSSSASPTSTSISLRNKSPILKNVTSPLKHAGKQAKNKNMTKVKNPGNAIKHTKRLTHSSLEDVSGSSSIVEETSKCKFVGSPLLQSAPRANGYKHTGKETDVIQNEPKHKKHSEPRDLQSVLEPNNDEVEKSRKRKGKSTNARKKTLSGNLKLTPVPPISKTRNKRSSSHSGSSVMEKGKKNSRNNKISREEKRKTKVSPCDKRKRETKMSTCIGGKRKREISLANTFPMEDTISSLDCLTDEFFNKRPRRRTVPVTLGTKVEKNAFTAGSKSKKKFSTRSQQSAAKTKSSSASRKNTSSTVTQDISLVPIDSITTFMSIEPRSAPAEVFKKSFAKGINSSIPKKGTLKRKRWLFNTLNKKNESYEDDIFENQKFRTPFCLPSEEMCRRIPIQTAK